MKVYLIEKGMVLGPKQFMSWDVFNVIMIQVNGKLSIRQQANTIIANKQMLESEMSANALHELAQFLDIRYHDRTVNQLRSDIQKKLERLSNGPTPIIPPTL